TRMLDSDILLTVGLELESVEAIDCALAAWIGRKSAAFGRVPATLEGRDPHLRLRALLSRDRFTDIGRGLLDVFVDVIAGGTSRRTRIGAAELQQPVGRSPAELYATQYKNLSIRLRPVPD